MYLLAELKSELGAGFNPDDNDYCVVAIGEDNLLRVDGAPPTFHVGAFYVLRVDTPAH